MTFISVNKISVCLSVIGIQTNQKELIKIFMMISNWKKPFGFNVLPKNNSAL